MDYDTLPAGPELDGLVSKQVFGHVAGREFNPLWPVRYSAFIELVWPVVEHLGHCRPRIERWGLNAWRVTFNVNADRFEDVSSVGDTAPLAICRAALKAVESATIIVARPHPPSELSR